MAIATSVGGIPDILEEGRSGFLATAADASAIDDALERAWSARNRWREMGRYAYGHIRDIMPDEPLEDFLAILAKTPAIVDVLHNRKIT